MAVVSCFDSKSALHDGSIRLVGKSLSTNVPSKKMYISTPRLLLNSDSTEETELIHNLHIFQFNNLCNQKELLREITSPTSTFPNCTVLDRSRIVSFFQLQMACTKAYMNQLQKRMISRSIYTEILVSLSHTKSISECFRNFGLMSSTRDIFVIVDADGDELVTVNQQFEKYIQGIRQDIPTFDADLEAIQRVFVLFM
jgi:tRNA threonylcarbamoyladenosine modification (KEOPS) complex Cgi121 subunit